MVYKDREKSEVIARHQIVQKLSGEIKRKFNIYTLTYDVICSVSMNSALLSCTLVFVKNIVKLLEKKLDGTATIRKSKLTFKIVI